MALQPSEFLTTAHGMLVNDDEGALRSAVSRAYYACFHEAMPVAVSTGFVVDSRSFSSHVSLSKHFGQLGGAREKELAIALNSLRVKRRRSDYDLNEIVGVEDAKAAVQEASDIMDLCNIIR